MAFLQTETMTSETPAQGDAAVKDASHSQALGPLSASSGGSKTVESEATGTAVSARSTNDGENAERASEVPNNSYAHLTVSLFTTAITYQGFI